MLDPELIPPPPVVRAKLAETHRRARLLRSLLRLSRKAAAEQAEHDRIFGHDIAPGPRPEVDGRRVAQ